MGIIGKEGRQAVNSSDFAFGQFRSLRSLLFVHGRANYRRIARFACHIFYLNLTQPLAQARHRRRRPQGLRRSGAYALRRHACSRCLLCCACHAQALFSLFAAFSTGGQFFPLVFTLL